LFGHHPSFFQSVGGAKGKQEKKEANIITIKTHY
jgi:hypothetical protein